MAKPICPSFILLVLLLVLVFQQSCSFHAAQDHLYDRYHHTNATTKCLDYERRALLQFKQGLYDPALRLSSWSTTTGDDDCCSWTGITCSSSSNLTTAAHVLKIDLRNHQPPSGPDKHWYYLRYVPDSSTALGGELHPSLLLLKHLQYLDLSFNDFKGIRIPAFIGSLGELRYLNLSTSGFTGNVPPHLGNLSNLQSLDLSDYTYSQMISIDDTTWISRLGSLEYLDLSYVSLAKDSNWLHSLNMLPSLLEIRLSGCGLSGSSLSLPYVNFTSLSTLDLSHNFISSTIPPWLFNLSRLEYLYLAHNSFQGQIPASISNLTFLKVLDLAYYTQLNVTLPSTFGNLCNLHSLDLSRLNLSPGLFADFHGIFSGCIKNSLIELRLPSTYPPSHMLDWIRSLKKLKILDLSRNGINSTLPSWLFNLTAMSYLDLRSNDFHGSVPSTIGNMISLESLFLSGNPNLDARMPVTLGNLCNLKILDLGDSNCSQNFAEYGDIFSGCIKDSLQQLFLQETSLSGQIPYEIGNLKNLTYLDLSVNSLSGSIPESIGNLGALNYLYLSDNKLNGTIPQSIGQLSGLLELNLKHNALTGIIPHEIGNLKKLSILDLSENSLSGSIPGSIGSLLSLELLELKDNRLNGTIPVSLGQLSGLYELDLGDNNLKGVLSEAHFGNLTRLERLFLSPNSLILRVGSDWVPPFQLKYLRSCVVGPKFPAWLRTQANLIHLDMSGAEISDAFPDWFWNLTGNIRYLNLSQNAITGTLPGFLNFSSLIQIDLSSNHLEGRVPQIPSSASVIDLSNNSFSGPIDTIISDPMPHLSYLSLSMNNINGSIPLSLCNATGLYVLDLSKNHLFGELPDCWNESAHMLIMDFSNNNVSGDVPNSICSLPNSLESLHLSNNGFSGLFPLSLRNCTKLITLDLSHNKFHGNIPDWIVESMPNIRALSLRWNDFSGYLPPQLSHLTELHILDLSNNKLSGSIPENFGEFNAMRSVNESSRIRDMNDRNVQTYRDTLMVVIKGQEHKYEKIIMALANVLDLSNNHLSGSIPEKLMNLSALQTLNLSRNHLTGGIPDKIGELQSLESLDLSMNNLTGVIPSSLANLNSLGRLNLSYNNLSGRIPSGKHFDTFGDTSIYIGNHDLCGLPLDKNCTSDKESPSSTYEDNDRSDEEWFYISMGIGFVFGLWTVFVIMLFKKNWRIAYFQSMDSIYDRVYVAVMVFFNRVKRKCQGKA
ncbi:hypothetical protein J5N97_028939 [Dioscorea zingiberensis]|uniref:Leucine-rich repeat-containing N-terminal plant-type domain-containing protein n=1 Tax=Dioscorea zingiberensis TaxID=325984 RepID=A0A9D5BZE5_9LILI|nr:hypothetical protein J5N97_028939 [Dioscorea zingiberensis]